ncbi:hypothetical protein MSIMFI_05507 [Mycobacterium simulans]|nr:hypothetical protein MSIMFI_05507 [Mycobacterium simulans]
MGNPPIASIPPLRRSHNRAGESTPPGNRHAIPTTATGSVVRSGARVALRVTTVVCPNNVTRYATTAAGLG